ncbi:MAG TPA: flavoprotein [Clostridia bacterium]|nr:flavoprotein [Clostridia bacterium]
MYSDEILSRIVEKVLQKLNQRWKNALVVFTGASIGFKEVMPQLKMLLEDGWNFKVVLSNSAEYVLTPQLIKKLLGTETVHLERETKALAALYKDAGLILIPTLSLNTAVKIALGVADSLVTNLTAHALMEGIPVVAAKNACDLRNTTRLQIGMNRTPEAYLKKTDQYLSVLESYGIELVEAGVLYKEVAERFGRLSAVSNKEIRQEACHFNKNVLSRMDVIDAKNTGTVLFIPHSTIVTALAYDTAKELGVGIVRV